MDYKIVKEGENKVIYTPIKTIKDINGKEFQFYDTENIKEYGAERIASEKASLFAEKVEISIYDKVVKTKEVDDKLRVLSEIETKF